MKPRMNLTGVKNALAIEAAIAMGALVVLRWSGYI